MDDGAAPRGDAGRVGECSAFLEVDGVAVSWYYDFCRERSPGVAEHYIARGRRRGSSSGDVMRGTAPSASGVARNLLRGPSEVVGYICLLLRLVPMRLEALSAPLRFLRS